MKKILLSLVIAIVTLAVTMTAVADREYRLVLVAKNNVDMKSFSPRDLRKIFLGNKVYQNNTRIVPLINKATPILDEVFLQKIVFMSKRHFNRQIMSNVYRRGLTKPKSYQSVDDAVRMLNEIPNTITYMWEETAEKHKLTVIQLIWRGKI